jgi:hypothetical protein
LVEKLKEIAGILAIYYGSVSGYRLGLGFAGSWALLNEPVETLYDAV